jgi:hypothetical protein
VNETPTVYLLFQATHTDVFTVTLMEGDNKLAGPVNVFRGQETKRMVTLCCGTVPFKFNQGGDGKKRDRLAVTNKELAPCVADTGC